MRLLNGIALITTLMLQALAPSPAAGERCDAPMTSRMPETRHAEAPSRSLGNDAGRVLSSFERRRPVRPTGRVAPDSPPVAFVGVSLVSMTSNLVVPSQTVVVRQGRIEAIGPAGETLAPPDALVIDGTGRYLMPGLADLHTHLGIELADGVNDAANQAEVYLAFGVTTIFNMGETLQPYGQGLMELRDRILVGELAGPTILGASIAYGPDSGVAAHHTVSSYEDGRRHVVESRQAGYDMIKVYTWVPEAAFDGIMDQARVEGLAVVGHIPRALGLGGSLSRGLAGVTHANQFWCGFFDCSIEPSKVQSAISLLRAYDTTVETTLYLNETFTDVYCRDTAALERFLAQPEMRYVHPLVIDHWRRQAAASGSTGCHKSDAEPSYKFIQEYSRAFYQAGVPFVLGTDSPPAFGVPGFSILEELRVVRASFGISPYEAIRLATKNADEFVSQHVPEAERFGTVEVGRRADLLLLDANPLQSLTNLRKRAGVMARGRWFPEDELQQRLDRIAGDYGQGR